MYSYDFIKIVIKAYNQRSLLNMTVVQIVSFYEISKQTLYNWLNNRIIFDNNMQIFNKSFRQSDKIYVKYITNYVKKHPQFNIKLLLKNLIFLFGIGISRQTIYNILKRNNITRKRIQINKYPHAKNKYNNELKLLRSSLKRRKNRIISKYRVYSSRPSSISFD